MAVIAADRCTGCNACLEVCPVDCIVKVRRGAGLPGVESWCEIDWSRCIGCRLCIRLARPQSDPYTLTVCPWDAIRMVPLADLPAAVESLGGPPEYAAAQAERRRREAAGQARLAGAGGGRPSPAPPPG